MTYEISNCSLQVSSISKEEKNEAVEQESWLYDDLLVVFYPIIEVLLMKILPFFNNWNIHFFQSYQRFQTTELVERPIPKTLDILVLVYHEWCWGLLATSPYNPLIFANFSSQNITFWQLYVVFRSVQMRASCRFSSSDSALPFMTRNTCLQNCSFCHVQLCLIFPTWSSEPNSHKIKFN